MIDTAYVTRDSSPIANRWLIELRDTTLYFLIQHASI